MKFGIIQILPFGNKEETSRTKEGGTQTTFDLEGKVSFLALVESNGRKSGKHEVEQPKVLTPLSVVGTADCLVTFKSFGIQFSTQAKYQILKSTQQFRNHRMRSYTFRLFAWTVQKMYIGCYNVEN